MRLRHLLIVFGVVIATVTAGLIVILRPSPSIADLQPYPASAATPVDLSPYLEAARIRTRLPALAAGVVSHSGVIAAGAVGNRRAGDGGPAYWDDAWHIGSLTKNMTAVLAARLVEQGVIDWNTTPGEVWTRWPDGFAPAWRDVPLHRFLRMNAGVTRTAEVSGVFERWVQSSDGTAEPLRQRVELVSAAFACPPAHAPGTSLDYSNFSYVIAARMLEIRTGRSYETLMAEQVFQPLGLTTAGFGAPETIWGHEHNGTPVPPGPGADNPAMLSPAGRVHLSAADYARYLQFLMTASRGESDLLSAESADILFTPFEAGEAYAMGWVVSDDIGPSYRVLSHTGSNTAWYAHVWMAPERDIAVFVFTNRGHAAEELDAIVWQLVLAELERSRAG